jgi:hypothetical protein
MGPIRWFELREAGVRFQQEPQTTAWGAHAIIEDPDGTSIVVVAAGPIEPVVFATGDVHVDAVDESPQSVTAIPANGRRRKCSIRAT